MREVAASSAPTSCNADNAPSTSPRSDHIDHRKKSSARSANRCSRAVAYELFKLMAIERSAAAQFHQGIGYEPKAGFAFISGRKICQSRSVEQYWFETFHSAITRTRHHRVAGAVKQRHAKAAAIVEREPVSIGASHGK